MLAPSTERRLPWGPACWRRMAILSLLGCSAVWFTRDWWVPAISAPSPPREDVGKYLAVVSSLNFGEAWESYEHALTVSLHNSRPAPIHIKRFDTSCDCAKVALKELTIPPGETRPVPVTIDLTRNKPASPDGTPWPTRYALRAEWTDANGRDRLSGWYITGHVKPLIGVKPSALWLGDELLRGKTGPSQSVTIKPLVPLKNIEIQTEPNGFTCALKRTIDGYHLSVAPGEKLATGFFSKAIVLSLTDVSGRPLPSQRVTVFGTLYDDVNAFPSTLYLGAVVLGRRIEESFVIRSRAGESVSACKIAAPQGTTAEAELRGGDCLIRVRHSAVKVGAGSSSLVVRVKVREQEQEIRIPIHWYGVLAGQSESTTP